VDEVLAWHADDDGSMRVLVAKAPLQPQKLGSHRYGLASADTAHQIVKKGLVLGNQDLSCPPAPPPVTSVGANRSYNACRRQYADQDRR